MESRTKEVLAFAKWTAIGSFIMGTAIFFGYCFSSETSVLFLGYLYLVVAGLINLIVMVVLILALRKQNDDTQHKIRKQMGMMLLNMPIAIVYCLIAMQVMGYLRVHLVNNTKEPISNIHIYGCDDKKITQMEPGESRNVWIRLDNDCSVVMEYLMNNKREEEVIMGYCTSGMGQKITYNIGSDNEIEFQ